MLKNENQRDRKNYIVLQFRQLKSYRNYSSSSCFYLNDNFTAAHFPDSITGGEPHTFDIEPRIKSFGRLRQLEKAISSYGSPKREI